MPQFLELHRLRFLQWMTISPIPPPNPTLRPKPIPYTSFCQNIPRICGVVFDFSSGGLPWLHAQTENLPLQCVPRLFLRCYTLQLHFSLHLQGMPKSHRPESWLESFFMLNKTGTDLDYSRRSPACGVGSSGVPCPRHSIATQQPPAAPPVPNAGKLAGRDRPHLLPSTSAQFRPAPGLPIAHLPGLCRKVP